MADASALQAIVLFVENPEFMSPRLISSLRILLSQQHKKIVNLLDCLVYKQVAESV
jgi:hypothetical protein